MGQAATKLKGTDTDLYVGPAGWSYEDWKGTVYPPDAPRGFRGLQFLSRTVDFILGDSV